MRLERARNQISERFERAQDMAWLSGGSPSEPHGGSINMTPEEMAARGGGGGAGGGFGAGWMRRMAGMDIARSIADIVATGSGEAFGMSGGFAAMGGAGMAAIGGSMAALGVLALEVKNIRDTIREEKEQQISFNTEIDMSRLKYGMLLESAEKLGPLTQAARAGLESATGEYLDAHAAVANAQIALDATYFMSGPEQAKLTGAERTEKYKAQIRDIQEVYDYGAKALSASTAIGQAMLPVVGAGGVPAIERQQALRDLGFAKTEYAHQIAAQGAEVSIAGMQPGWAKERADGGRVRGEAKRA